MMQDKDLTFEAALERLQEIVGALESGELSLESSMKLYKEGVACSLFCREKLSQAKQELEIWQSGEAVQAQDIGLLEDEQDT